MPNTSATGGYLLPNIVPAPLQGLSFQVFIQSVIVGITNLPGQLVRPVWQPEPANLPDINTNWVALTFTSYEADTYAYIKHDPTSQGSDELQRHETVNLRCMFYGPNADENAGLLRDGLLVPQNRDQLSANSVGVQSFGVTVTAPTFVKELWYYRVDQPIILRRRVKRSYPIFNLLSAQGGIFTTNNINFMFLVDGSYKPPVN